MHDDGVSELLNEDGAISEEFIRSVAPDHTVSADAVDDDLVNALQTYITRTTFESFPAVDSRNAYYWLEVVKLKIYGSFPPEESAIQGPVRAFLYDSKCENLTALTPEQRVAIDAVITAIQNIVTRSKDGFDREQINTTTARTEGDDTDTGTV